MSAMILPMVVLKQAMILEWRLKERMALEWRVALSGVCIDNGMILPMMVLEQGLRQWYWSGGRREDGTGMKDGARWCSH